MRNIAGKIFLAFLLSYLTSCKPHSVQDISPMEWETYFKEVTNGEISHSDAVDGYVVLYTSLTACANCINEIKFWQENYETYNIKPLLILPERSPKRGEIFVNTYGFDIDYYLDDQLLLRNKFNKPLGSRRFVFDTDFDLVNQDFLGQEFSSQFIIDKLIEAD